MRNSFRSLGEGGAHPSFFRRAPRRTGRIPSGCGQSRSRQADLHREWLEGHRGMRVGADPCPEARLEKSWEHGVPRRSKRCPTLQVGRSTLVTWSRGDLVENILGRPNQVFVHTSAFACVWIRAWARGGGWKTSMQSSAEGELLSPSAKRL